MRYIWRNLIHRSMKRILYSLFSMSLLSAPLVAQQVGISNVSFNPSQPNGCESFIMTVTGFYPASNYEFLFYTIGLEGNTMTLGFNASSSGMGSPVLTPFNAVIPPAGPFPGGTYNFVAEFYLNDNLHSTWTTTFTILPALEPNAGELGFIDVCTTAPPFPLISVLDGNPDTYGTWLDPFGFPHPANFTPGVSQPGIYTYEINLPEPCVSVSQLAIISYLPNSSAGVGGPVTMCSVGDPVDLFPLILGTPDPGGTWTGPGGSSFNGTFVPGTNTAGQYRYTVPGIAPCDGPTAILQVTVANPSNAGLDVTGLVCETTDSVQLRSFLTPGHTPNGVFYDQIFPVGDYNVWVLTAAMGTGETYRYIVGTSPCVPDTSFMVLTVEEEPCTQISVGPELELVRRFDVMPNPNDGRFFVELEWERQGERFLLELRDALGRVVFSEEVVASGTMERREMDFHGLPKGLYMLALRSVQGSEVRRVVTH